MKVSALRRVLVLVALVGIIASFTAPANAASPLRGKLICVATGFVSVSVPVSGAPDTVTWRVIGQGLCTGDQRGPYLARFTGAGQSTDLGFCDNLVVQDLGIKVSLQISSLTTSTTSIINQTWFAPLTTFPYATPFFVNNDADTLAGAGFLSTRFAGKCPGHGGNEAANFAWAFLRP